MIALTGSEFFAALRDAQFFLDEVCLEMCFLENIGLPSQLPNLSLVVN